MDVAIWKPLGERSFFVDNILVGVKHFYQILPLFKRRL